MVAMAANMKTMASRGGVSAAHDGAAASSATSASQLGFGDRFSFVSRIERSAHVGVDAKRTTCIVRAGDGDEFLESLRECAVAERRVMQFGVRTVGGRVERRQIA